MRLLICAGGTGGGVYPALAVLQALQAKRPGVETLWVGGTGGMESEIVRRTGIPFTSIPAAGLHGVGLRKLPGNALRMARGTLAAIHILRKFRPDVLFFTGGYIAAPMALAGRNLPSLLYVPDIQPGLALSFLTRFSDCIAVTTSASLNYYKKRERIAVIGYPVRNDLTGWSREKAVLHLGLDPNLPTLLVFGGSKGARSINTALLRHLPVFLELAQVLHITGKLDWENVKASADNLEKRLGARYHPMPYLHEMGAALASASLVISRSGASSLGEFPLFGLPAILVPYPHAWRYQKVNADYLALRGAAVILEDERLNNELPELVRDLLKNPNKLEAMHQAMRALSQPNAAQRAADLLLELAGIGS